MIQGMLHPLSVPPGGGQRLNEIHPISWRPEGSVYDPDKYSNRGAINPCQDRDKNLDAEAVAFGVGGMMQHWTAATPRHHPKLERYRFEALSDFQNDEVWNEIYTEAEQILGTNDKSFDHSIRNAIVLKALTDHYAGRLPSDYGVKNLPMAVERSTDPHKSEFVIYTGADRILGSLLDPPNDQYLEILPENRVNKLVLKAGVVAGSLFPGCFIGHSRSAAHRPLP
jgi:pyranose oxidase